MAQGQVRSGQGQGQVLHGVPPKGPELGRKLGPELRFGLAHRGMGAGSFQMWLGSRREKDRPAKRGTHRRGGRACQETEARAEQAGGELGEALKAKGMREDRGADIRQGPARKEKSPLRLSTLGTLARAPSGPCGRGDRPKTSGSFLRTLDGKRSERRGVGLMAPPESRSGAHVCRFQTAAPARGPPRRALTPARLRRQTWQPGGPPPFFLPVHHTHRKNEAVYVGKPGALPQGPPAARAQRPGSPGLRGLPSAAGAGQ